MNRLEKAVTQDHLMEDTVDAQFCSNWLKAEIKALFAEIARLKAAMMADIRGAGPMTGPIFHSEIRRALGLPAEGDLSKRKSLKGTP